MLNIVYLPDDILSIINLESKCILSKYKKGNICQFNKYLRQNLNQNTSCFVYINFDNDLINITCRNHTKNKISLHIDSIKIYIIL